MHLRAHPEGRLKAAATGVGSIGTAKNDDLVGALRSLRGRNGVLATTVISRDGLPLASDLPPEVNPDVLALRTAFMQGIGEVVMESVEAEEARTVIVVADQHYIMTTAVDEGHILVAVLQREVDVGELLPTVEGTAERVRSMLGA